MGHGHKKPADCLTIFECPPKKRSQVFQRALNDAYNKNPIITSVLMSLSLLLLAVGIIIIMYYRARRNGRKIRKLKYAEAYRAAVEKGEVPAFSDNV